MSFPAWISGNKQNHGSHKTKKGMGKGSVPTAKKPQSRPPQGVRDHLSVLQRSLPKYMGPYSVGVMDIEVPVREAKHYSNITRGGEKILKLETVLMTIYYPAVIGSGQGPDPSGRKHWSRATWLPRPRGRVAIGYGNFAGVGPLGIPWFAATTMFTKLPAFRNAPPADHWPPQNDVAGARGWKVKNQRGEPPQGYPESPEFPTMIFSHGLGGNRSCYSTICGEFASHGFVVCAIEHRDGSGPRTFVNHEPTLGRNGSIHSNTAAKLPNGIASRKSTGVKRSKLKREEVSYEMIDYIWPKGNPYDTSPSNDQGVDKELRTDQLQLRIAEIEEAHHVLATIASGDGELIALKNLRRKGMVGSSSRGLEGVNWNLWKGRFDVSDITMVGHSFGAATTVEALRCRDRMNYICQGIILDIWGAPVKLPQDAGTEHLVHAPVLAINSEAFMYWQSNFDVVHHVAKEAMDQDAPAWVLTVKGTIHISQSDFALLYPHVITALLKMTANPRRALDLNINASLEFLCSVMPSRHVSVISRAYEDERILQAEVIDEIPGERKPKKDEYLAARLEVDPKDVRKRFLPKFERKKKRLEKSLGEVHGYDEVWMHVATEPEMVQAYRARMGKPWTSPEFGTRSGVSDGEESSEDEEDDLDGEWVDAVDYADRAETVR